MNLYKTTVAASEDHPAATLWSGSMAAAGGDRARFVAAGAKRKDVTTVDVNIPTDKIGLLNFLNSGEL